MSLVWVAVVPLESRAQTAQSPAPPVERIMVATPLDDESAITLDGRLDEAVWSRALPAADFLQMDPDNGSPATERTEVRVVFDNQRLYLGIVCYDTEPGRLLGNQMQRDQSLSADDRFMWVLDTYLDGRGGYLFELNPSGAMGDGLVEPGESTAVVNRSWDGIWNARVRRSEVGWTAEVELPFRTLNFNRQATAWGINFQRTVRRKNEEILWSGYARNQGLTRLSAAGRLAGLAGISQGLGLDVKPYVVGRLLSAPGRGRPDTVRDATGGVDFFYNVTPALRANFTVNTDFAETEVDQRRVNLTRFPLFFPEKRDFFLEGSSFFDFSRERGSAVVPFFSRRIGLSSLGVPQPIDFGLKLTGQVGEYSVGLLQVKTRQEEQFDAEQFTVVRARRQLQTQSYAGLIYTRRGGSPDSPVRHTAGGDYEFATSRFRGSQNLSTSGFYLFTSDPLKTDSTSAYGVRLEYPNDPLAARIHFREVQTFYDPAVGFYNRRNYRRLNPVIDYTPRPREHPYIRRYSFGTHIDYYRDLHNELLSRILTFRPFGVDFHSGDAVQANVVHTLENLDEDFDIYPGITIPAGGSYAFTRYSGQIDTASRRPVSLSAQYEAGGFYSGDRTDVTLALSFRPGPGWNFTVEGERADVNLVEGQFVTHVVRGLVQTQLSPWISIVNNLQYDDVSRILGWQFRFRWITRPGSDVYLVFTQNWLDSDRLSVIDRRSAAKFSRTYGF